MMVTLTLTAPIVLPFLHALVLLLVLQSFSGSGVASSDADSATSRTLFDVLGVEATATQAEIKKSYRSLALKHHPDKIPHDSPNIEELKDLFIAIQAAYDVLGDEEKRRKYELSMSGVDYDIYTDPAVDRYHDSERFRFFAKGKKFGISITAKFKKKDIPSLDIFLEVPLGKSFTGMRVDKSYFRRVICDQCGGKGGVGNDCRKCELCGGTGVADHLFSLDTKDFMQYSEHICSNCNGNGCIVNKKCDKCKGTGYTMKEEKVTLVLLEGFANGATVPLPKQGHQQKDGRFGDAIVHIQYEIPIGFKYDSETGDLSFDYKIELDEFLKGFKRNIITPANETVMVKIDKSRTSELSAVLGGIDEFLVNKGAWDVRSQKAKKEDDHTPPERAHMHVHFEVNWSTLTFESMVSTLKAVWGAENESVKLMILMMSGQSGSSPIGPNDIVIVD